MGPSFSFSAESWRYPGKAGWVFVTLPTGTADEILDAEPPTGGFGSVRVSVRIGGTTWRTSLFPDRRAASFVLPIKRPVRDAESIEIGDTVDVTVEIVTDGR
jgi:hypothetical protein